MFWISEEDSRLMGRLLKTLCVLAILGVVLGIWKLIEIGIWLIQHVRIDWSIN